MMKRIDKPHWSSRYYQDTYWNLIVKEHKSSEYYMETLDNGDHHEYVLMTNTMKIIEHLQFHHDYNPKLHKCIVNDSRVMLMEEPIHGIHYDVYNLDGSPLETHGEHMAQLENLLTLWTLPPKLERKCIVYKNQ